MGNPSHFLSLKNVVEISGLLTASGIFTVFLPEWQFNLIVHDESAFFYALMVYIGGVFFSNLLGLLGLADLISSRKRTG